MSDVQEISANKFTMSYYTKYSNIGNPQYDLIWCLNFATEAHKYQKRKDEKTPYINHPIGVAYIMSEEAKITNLDMIRGCLLHDTVEDTAVLIEEIRTIFGDYIGNLIQEVTDDKSLPKQKRKDLQIIHSQTSSIQAKLVKLADKLYNLRDLETCLPRGWTEERRKDYYIWAFKVCEGLRGVSSNLEKKLDEIFIRKGLIIQQEPRDEIIENLPWTNHDELKPLIAAANFAAEKHRCHFLFDSINSVPYINHVASVAFIVSQEILDIVVLCAALLHGVVSKTDLTIEEIVKTFGKEVGQLVDELTYNLSLSIEEQFKSQVRRAGNMSYNAKVIILAAVIDKCSRLQEFEPEGWSQELQDNYFKWSLQLCRLLANTNTQLEQQLEKIWETRGVQDSRVQEISIVI